jgi:drug/metabolite transporter superfamily protein YnfA
LFAWLLPCRNTATAGGACAAFGGTSTMVLRQWIVVVGSTFPDRCNLMSAVFYEMARR